VSLFPDRRSAIFSEDRKYRVMLRVVWDDTLPCVGFVALNPSKADEFKDDNTSRKLIGFAKRLGFGSMVLFNIFALGATDPRELYVAADPIGRHEDIGQLLRRENPRVVIACWGAHGKLHGRGEIVSAQIQKYFSGARLRCFGYNIDLSPKHPLYLANDSALMPFPYSEVRR